MPDEDVKDAASSAAGEQAVEQTDATVTGAQGDDRPVQNVVAEFNRKFAKTQQQLDTVLQWIAATQLPQQQAKPVAQPKELTDEELYALAQQGDQAAYAEWTRRQARQVYQQESAVQRKATMQQNQLAVYYGKYPVLNNAQHPLTQHVGAVYQALLGNGYAQGQETMLEAIKLGVADRPDLVAAEYNSGATTRENVRRSASQTAQTGVTGVSHRQSSPTPSNQPKKLSTDQLALARRMGLSPKQAEKAVKGFLQRQEDGLSKLGAVSGFVDSEEL